MNLANVALAQTTGQDVAHLPFGELARSLLSLGYATQKRESAAHLDSSRYRPAAPWDDPLPGDRTRFDDVGPAAPLALPFGVEDERPACGPKR